MENKGITSTAMLDAVYAFAEKQGLTVEWSGLCIWATPAHKPRKGSRQDKAMGTAGFKWSGKRKAYYCRAANGFDTPKKGYRPAFLTTEREAA